MAIDITRTRLCDYNVAWGSYSFGAVDKVTPDITIKTSPIKVGSIGDVVLGERVVALEGNVKVEMREFDVAAITAMMPWGASSLLPATVNEDLYNYAAILNLHPTDVAGGTLSQDLNLIKAVPMLQLMDLDGKKDGLALITFKFYPDRSVLPTLSYGYVGPVPG